MTTSVRTDTWENSVVIDGVDYGVWDTFKGGDVDSEAKTYKPGGMRKQKTISGSQTVSNITVDKLMDLETDWALCTGLMRTTIGRSAVTVIRQPLDLDGNPFGRPLVYTGKLKQVIPGDTDSNKSDGQVWSVVVVPDGDIS